MMMDVNDKFAKPVAASSNNITVVASSPCNLQLSSSSLIPYPFVQKQYPIQIYLYDSQRKLVQGHHIPVELLLFYEGSEQPLPITKILSYEPKELSINSLGILECQIEFHQVSMEHSNRKFFLQFRIQQSKIKSLIPSLFSSMSEEQAVSPASAFYSVNTIPMLVIQRRFSVQLEMNNNTTYSNSATEDDQPSNLNGLSGGNASTQSYIWYKDEGGKDHGIELTISLINKEHEALLGEEIPFLITLHYQNHTDTALNATNLYTIIPDNNHVIDKFSGKCYKKLRIHDISKNHQRQCFVIKISPDISKSSKYFDIASDESAPIEVRSKRSKRSRDHPNSSDVASVSTTIGGGGGLGLRSGSSSTNLTALISSAAVSSAPVIGVGSHLLDKGGLTSGTNTLINGRKRAKLSSTGSDVTYPPPPPPPPLSSLSYNSVAVGSGLGKGFAVSADSDDLNQGNEVDRAYYQVSKWIDDVLQNLQLIRWKPIGYHNPHPTLGNDLSAPTGEPLYAIPNPNDMIDSLLEKYSNDVYHNLALLLKQHHMRQVKSETGGTSTGGGGKGGGKKRNQNNNNNNNNSSSNSNSNNNSNSSNGIVNGNSSSRQLLPSTISSNHVMDFNSTAPPTTSTFYPPPPPSASFPTSNAVASDELLFRGRANSMSNGNYPETAETQKDWKTVINYIEQANAKISESQVYYIISKPYDFQKNELSSHANASSMTSEMLYFPAFDIDHNLVGFYTETKDQKNSTVILFIPINSPIISPDLINLTTAKQILETMIYQVEHHHSPPLDLHSLNQKNNNFDLEALKHNAIVHYWFSEIGLDDDF